MKKVEKIELLLLCVLIVLQFLTFEGVLSSLVLLFTSIILAFYFNPFRIVLVLKEDVDKYYRIAINILLSITMIMSYVALKFNANNSVHLILLLLTIISLILIFVWSKKRKTSDLYLLFLNVFILSGAYFI